MIVRERRDLALERERRTGGSQRVVRLVASAVEDGEEAVSDELLELAAEVACDQRRRNPQ